MIRFEKNILRILLSSHNAIRIIAIIMTDTKIY